MGRTWIVACALALAAAACTPGETAGEAGWRFEIAAAEDAQIYYVAGPDGQEAAARVRDGASEVIAAAEARTAIGAQTAITATDDEANVAIKAPGFSLSIDANEDAGGDQARIRMSAGGTRLEIDADDSAAAEDRALIRMSGVDAEDARRFIDGAEELSPETKAALKAAVGL